MFLEAYTIVAIEWREEKKAFEKDGNWEYCQYLIWQIGNLIWIQHVKSQVILLRSWRYSNRADISKMLLKIETDYPEFFEQGRKMYSISEEQSSFFPSKRNTIAQWYGTGEGDIFAFFLQEHDLPEFEYTRTPFFSPGCLQK